MNNYININENNIDKEHLCCAISDPKHNKGVDCKKKWLLDRLKEGHVFRKLDCQGKVFIEYAPLETAWVPVCGENMMYIYCLWVAGSYKGNGYAKELLQYAIEDAKRRKMDGVCVISSVKKKPFLAEKKFFEKFGFKVVDKVRDFELLALDFDKNVKPQFSDSAKKMHADRNGIVIYYSKQCPYINNSINEIENFAKENNVCVDFIEVNSASRAKEVPCVFNNWATFVDGNFISNTIMNKNSFEKLVK